MREVGYNKMERTVVSGLQPCLTSLSPFIGRKLEFCEYIPKGGLAKNRMLGLIVGEAKKVKRDYGVS